MSKRVIVAGQSYDSRTVVTKVEKLKLPNHPKVNALAVPIKEGENLSGKMTLVVKVPFGRLDANVKELHITLPSPRRIDAINRVVEEVKKLVMYRREQPKQRAW